MDIRPDIRSLGLRDREYVVQARRHNGPDVHKRFLRRQQARGYRVVQDYVECLEIGSPRYQVYPLLETRQYFDYLPENAIEFAGIFHVDERTVGINDFPDSPRMVR